MADSTEAVTYPLIGKKEVIIGKELFPPELVQDDGCTVTVTPSTTDVSSQAGTIPVPNGAFDEISASVSLIINSVETLMRIFPNLSERAQFNGGKTGVVHFGATECKTTEPVPVIIRNACDTDSAQDIRIPRALIQPGGEFDISQGDPVTLEVNITPLPTTNGYVEFGEGNLTKATKWDVNEGAYKPIENTEQSGTTRSTAVTTQSKNN